jgi:hypothetical protein
MLRLQLQAFLILVFLLSGLAAVWAAEYMPTLLEAPPAAGTSPLPSPPGSMISPTS